MMVAEVRGQLADMALGLLQAGSYHLQQPHFCRQLVFGHAANTWLLFVMYALLTAACGWDDMRL